MMLESTVWACCASNCTLLAALPCFFRSRYVRATTLLSISQARKWSPVSVVVIFKIEVARDFYVTKQRISTSWGCLSTSRLLEESSLRRASVADGCLHRRELRGFKLSLCICRSNSASFHFTQTFPEKVLVVSNHALLKTVTESF